MPRASLATRPEAHECCPFAKEYLETFSSMGEWSWRINRAFTDNEFVHSRTGWRCIVLTHCPWCGEKLPKQGRPKLRSVK
jgi:hypothetical protein